MKKNINLQHIHGTRKDGTRYLLAQVGDAKICEQQYYRYYYADILKDNQLCNASILYSDTNVAHLIDARNFNKNIPQGYEETVGNILFSKENIADSKRRGTGYIGKVTKDKQKNQKGIQLVEKFLTFQNQRINKKNFNFLQKNM